MNVQLLSAILFAGLLAMWIDARWAFGAIQAALFAAVLWQLARRPAKLHWMMAVPAGAVLIGLLQLGFGWSVYGWRTETALLDWFTWLATFWLAYQVLDGEPEIHRFLRGAAIFAGAVSLVALLLRFTEIRNGVPVGRMGPFIYENQYANFIEMTLPPALAACMEKAATRLWPVLMAAVMIVSVFVSGSVTGSVLILLEAAIILFLAGRRRRDYRLLAAIAAAAGVFAGVTGVGLLTLDLERQNALLARKQTTLASVEMALERPWTGFGLGTWSTAYPAFARFDDGMFDNQAHDDWAQWAAEGGIPLFVLMLVLAAGISLGSRRRLWGLGLVAVLAHALVDYPFEQRPALGCLFFALAAALMRDAEGGAEEMGGG